MVIESVTHGLIPEDAPCHSHEALIFKSLWCLFFEVANHPFHSSHGAETRCLESEGRKGAGGLGKIQPHKLCQLKSHGWWIVTLSKRTEAALFSATLTSCERSSTDFYSDQVTLLTCEMKQDTPGEAEASTHQEAITLYWCHSVICLLNQNT